MNQSEMFNVDSDAAHGHLNKISHERMYLSALYILIDYDFYGILD